MNRKLWLLSVLVFLVGCSPVMEANRPDPVDMSQFVIGEKRIKVLSAIGAPTATVKDGKNSCDIYKLYVEGHSGAEKGAIAAGEVVADVFTLGLSEVVFTPAEGATGDEKQAVTFCYKPNDTLVSIDHPDADADTGSKSKPAPSSKDSDYPDSNKR
ncbi:MAG TPA: hypothetical protein VMV79_02990 [Alphaproteobacteria bacterium]|nr:hypothetical protein [Alphaproteobacteria bacterium]